MKAGSTYADEGKDGHESHDGQHVAPVDDTLDSVLDTQIWINVRSLLLLGRLARAALVPHATHASCLDLDAIVDRESSVVHLGRLDHHGVLLGGVVVKAALDATQRVARSLVHGAVDVVELA